MRSRVTPAGLAGLAALIVPGLPDRAAAQPVVLDDIVITPDRDAIDAARTGSDVSVITGEQIDDDGRPFVLDVVSDLPGVTTSQNGPAGTVSGFAVRGAPQQYVRVQIDGIEISDPTAPQVAPSLSGLLLDDVSRIELLRGSQSAVYGGQAVGGVLEITTARAERDGFASRVRLEGGSYETFRGSVALTGRGERGEFALSLARLQTDGFSAAEEDDGNPEDDGYDTTLLSGSGTLALGDAVSLFASGFYQDEDGEFDEGFPIADAPNTFTAESWGLRGGIDVAALDGRLENRLAVSHYDIDRRQVSAFGPFITDGSRTRAEYLGAYDVSDALDLRFGADWTEETSQSNFSGGEADNTIYGLYGQAIWAPVDPLTLNAALRYDEHSEFGSYPTGRLTVAYALPTQTVLRGSVGTGFRAPSNFELFDAFAGNPELDPETSVSVDLGVEQGFAAGRGTVGATLFWLEIDDLIDFDDAGRFFQSNGTSESRGLELTGGWDVTDRYTLSGAYTYTDAELPDGQRRNRIPRHDLVLGLDGRFGERTTAGLVARAVWDYPDRTGPEETANFEEDYVVLDARAAYAITDEAELYVRAENLLDAEYQTARGYGTADLGVYVGLRGRF